MPCVPVGDETLGGGLDVVLVLLGQVPPSHILRIVVGEAQFSRGTWMLFR